MVNWPCISLSFDRIFRFELSRWFAKFRRKLRAINRKFSVYPHIFNSRSTRKNRISMSCNLIYHLQMSIAQIHMYLVEYFVSWHDTNKHRTKQKNQTETTRVEFECGKMNAHRKMSFQLINISTHTHTHAHRTKNGLFIFISIENHKFCVQLSLFRYFLPSFCNRQCLRWTVFLFKLCFSLLLLFFVFFSFIFALLFFSL